MQIKADELCECFGDYILDAIGDREAYFSSFSPAEGMCPESLIWLNKKTVTQMVASDTAITANVVVVQAPFDAKPSNNQCYILTSNPRLLFIKILNKYFVDHNSSAIHPSSYVAPGTVLGDNVHIGPFCCIDQNVIIGDNTFLEGNVRIYKNATIGSNVIFQSGVVIGSDVLSFARDLDNSYVRFPSFGSVIIEDSVEIGSNATVVKASIGKTIIGHGTKINANVYIGSSVEIGPYNYIASGVNINGSAHIGSDNFIGSGSVVRNKAKIGSNNTIGAGAVVVKDIGDDKTFTGNPATENQKSKGVKL
jgi:UDP-3-O-[3-hydroxymyristoyl] glucosamine N-acyltransferase